MWQYWFPILQDSPKILPESSTLILSAASAMIFNFVKSIAVIWRLENCFSWLQYRTLTPTCKYKRNSYHNALLDYELEEVGLCRAEWLAVAHYLTGLRMLRIREFYKSSGADVFATKNNSFWIHSIKQTPLGHKSMKTHCIKRVCIYLTEKIRLATPKCTCHL